MSNVRMLSVSSSFQNRKKKIAQISFSSSKHSNFYLIEKLTGIPRALTFKTCHILKK